MGYQNREGTYTGKLAYVIYFDGKGKLRKETSWQSWRDKSIEPVEYTNEPTEGFVLNKKVGGSKESWGWNVRQEKVRVYDPRGFEFEISVPNLLFILRESNCSKGKGLEGKFCYAWCGPELILIPESSEDYKFSKNYTSLQTKGVKAKDLILGAAYLTKKQESWIYLGKLEYHFLVRSCIKHTKLGSYTKITPPELQKGFQKRHVFWDGRDFVLQDSLVKLAKCQSETPDPQYANLLETWIKSAHGSKVVGLFTKSAKDTPEKQWEKKNWVCEDTPGVYTSFVNHTTRLHPSDKEIIMQIRRWGHYFLKDGALHFQSDSEDVYTPEYLEYFKSRNRDFYARELNASKGTLTYRPPSNLCLWAKMESGVELPIHNSNFERDR